MKCAFFYNKQNLSPWTLSWNLPMDFVLESSRSMLPHPTTRLATGMLLGAAAFPIEVRPRCQNAQRAHNRLVVDLSLFDSAVVQGQALCVYSGVVLFSTSQLRHAIGAGNTPSVVDGCRWEVAATRTRMSPQMNVTNISPSPGPAQLTPLQSPNSFLHLSPLKIATIFAAMFIACASPCTSATRSRPAPLAPSAPDAAGRVSVKQRALMMGNTLSSYAAGQGIYILSTRITHKKFRAGTPHPSVAGVVAETWKETP